MNKMFLSECFLQETNRYDALKVWKKLEIGVELYIYQEGDLVKVKLKDTENLTIGILSREDSRPMKPYLDAKWNSEDDGDSNKALYTCVISKIDDKADENKKISVCIFVKYPG